MAQFSASIASFMLTATDSYQTVKVRICAQRIACYMKMGARRHHPGQRKGHRIPSYIFKRVSANESHPLPQWLTYIHLQPRKPTTSTHGFFGVNCLAIRFRKQVCRPIPCCLRAEASLKRLAPARRHPTGPVCRPPV